MRQLNRRAFLTIASAGAASWALGARARAQAAPKNQPNVLFIAIDDLNDWVGCLGGNPDAITPNLDKLAERCVNFTNAFCAAPACNPSRASLMTGILPSTSGVYQNPQPWRPMMPDAVTIPQHFMAHGYRAAGGGKIYHGRFPDDASWHEYFKRSKDAKGPAVKRNAGGIVWGAVDGGDDVIDDHRVVDWAIGELEAKQDKPFFLACGIYKPHMPWYVPKKYFDMHPRDKITLPRVKEDDLDDVPQMGKDMAKPGGDHATMLKAKAWREAVQAYLAASTFADAQVGRLIAALDKSSHADNTIIVLWSDHGWHLGEKLHWRKFSLWEEATHNLLMIAAPGVTKPGGRCARPVGLIDIYPTLIDLCGLDAKPELEGESLLHLLKNPGAKRARPALTTHGRNNHTLRSERWRYVRYSDGSEELYDRDKDPMEWTNLASDPANAGIIKRLAKWLPKKNAPEAPRTR